MRVSQKRAEATGDLIANKIADKITKTSKNNSKTDKNELEIPKERYIYIYIYLQKKGNKLLMN